MNKKCIKSIAQELLNSSECLNSALISAQQCYNEENYLKFKELISHLMADIYFDGLHPIYKEYPELIPDELKKTLSKNRNEKN